jgi:glutamyl-tRNA reductase
MHLLLTGISYKTAPVGLRERLALTGGTSGQTIHEALHRLRRAVPVDECALITTCNRTELYAACEGSSERGARGSGSFLPGAKSTGSRGWEQAAAPDGCPAPLSGSEFRAPSPEPERSDWQERILAFFADYGGLPAPRLQPHLYGFEGAPAARHLFRVACGLDSMILGEAQIQAQVKDGLLRAQEAGAAGKVIDSLFRAALTTGKRAREETEITRGAVSVSLAAVELARQIFGHLQGHTALVLGAGETSEQTARLLIEAGIESRLLVCNRTLERAQAVAGAFGGEAYAFEELPQALVRADIVIASTGAPHAVLHRDTVRQGMRQRRGRPLFLIDIAVPRDVEPEVGDLDDVFLYDIDDLHAVVGKNLAVRQSEVERVETIIEEELARFQGWLRGLVVAPTIGDLHRKGEAIAQAELARLGGKISHLSDRDREVVATLVHGVINKVLREPILHLREAAASGSGHDSVAVIRDAFALDEEKPVRDAPCAPQTGRSFPAGGLPGSGIASGHDGAEGVHHGEAFRALEMGGAAWR